METKTRIMALDVGDKKIGVAVSDPLGLTAGGLDVILRVGARRDADAVIARADEYDCALIVVGLPVNLNGSHSVQTDKAVEFGRLLENKLRSSGRKTRVEMYDERFTTLIAERVLTEADLSREKRKAVIDKQAATVILQGYLERQRNAGENRE